MSFDITIVGGCGHVGLPLGIAFALKGKRVSLYDHSQTNVDIVNSGKLPFREDNALAPLKEVVSSTMLTATTNPEVIATSEVVIVVVGTPVDEHYNPESLAVPNAMREIFEHMHDGQLLVLRSTVFPGVTRRVERELTKAGLAIDVAFCPERIVEGKAMEELFTLPQIVSSHSPLGSARASELFGVLTDKIVELSPEEAELAKLFTNSWRYIKFAAANQFFMLAERQGLNYERIRQGLAQDYDRAKDLPGAGFAAGPCLLKDTMQLAAFADNNFALGQAAVNVNEGLPMFVVTNIGQRYPLETMTVGVLGMAFKGDSDDTRSSLSYKLRRLLRFRCDEVLCADPFVTTDPTLVPEEEVLRRADLIVIGTPHSRYRSLETTKPVVDIWNVVKQQAVITLHDLALPVVVAP